MNTPVQQRSARGERLAAALDEAAMLVHGTPPRSMPSPSPQRAVSPPQTVPPRSPAASPSISPRGTLVKQPADGVSRDRSDAREDSRGRSGGMEVKETGHVLSKAASVLAACRAHYLASARKAHWEAMAQVAEATGIDVACTLEAGTVIPTDAELRLLLDTTLTGHALQAAARLGMSEEERLEVVAFGSATITAGQLDALVTQLAKDLAADEATLAAHRAEVALLETDVAHNTARLKALQDSSAAQQAAKAVADEEADLDRALATARTQQQELAHRSHALRRDAEVSVAPVFTLEISAGRAVRHEGWLHKQGHIVRSWKRRYFSLAVQPNVSAVLYYFKHQSDLRPAGLAELRACTVTELPVSAGYGAHAFHVSLPSGRIYLLRADSATERASWLIEIQKAAFA